MIANKFLEVARLHIRRVDARNEVARVMRKKRARRVEHLAIDAQNHLAIRDVQLVAQILGVVDVAPQLANFNAAFFLLRFTSSGLPGSENAYFTASNASP